VLARLGQPCRLVILTCIATGARISEVLGLQWKHVDLEAGTIRIEQRVWRQEIAPPKTEQSRRVLGLGDLVPQFAGQAALESAPPESFVFAQKRAPAKPLWDSGVRDALHHAARAESCDFPGLGPHSFRRANITWRQQVGGSAIEASRIAGHSGLNMTSEYTFVTAERQNELTRRIQEKLASASNAISGHTAFRSDIVSSAHTESNTRSSFVRASSESTSPIVSGVSKSSMA
jgi:integrase